MNSGAMAATEIFRSVNMDLTKYALTRVSDNINIYQAKTLLSVKTIKSSNESDGEKIDQDIEIVFSAEYCINAEQLGHYKWQEQGYLKNSPVHLMRSPPEQDDIILVRTGYRFIVEQTDGLETTVKFIKPCAEDIFIALIWQDI